MKIVLYKGPGRTRPAPVLRSVDIVEKGRRSEDELAIVDIGPGDDLIHRHRHAVERERADRGKTFNLQHNLRYSYVRQFVARIGVSEVEVLRPVDMERVLVDIHAQGPP